MKATSGNKGRFAAFLENRFVQLFSAALLCGLLGFTITAIAAGAIFGASHGALVAAAMIGSSACATLGAFSHHSVMSREHRFTPERDTTGHLVSFCGAAMLASGALQYLGVLGTTALLASLAIGLISAICLAVISRI